MDLGKLEKMKILAFKDDAFTKPAIPPSFPVFVNPESYSLDYSVEYNTDTAQGNNGTSARYTKTNPEEFKCELWFDNTGILDGIPRPSVQKETEDFKNFLLDIESDTHDLRHFQVVWGTMLFKGRVTALQMEYKLFKPDGTPIRAKASVTFKGSFDDVLRLAKANLLSPDLTHVRVVKSGDTLPNLCKELYGSSRHCIDIARINGLANFRRLAVGQELIFPPFDKKETA